jgi:hypothetical protein
MASRQGFNGHVAYFGGWRIVVGSLETERARMYCGELLIV